jgi:amidase
MLLASGASLVGKTLTDEMAWSLTGINNHFGAPLNPAAPDRITGGSSSGSAVAVASGLVDFAVGTDTAGSTRVPAAFCHLFGMRPTHGLLPLDGCVPFAPEFDTVGGFARDVGTFSQVTTALLPNTAGTSEVQLCVAKDMVDLCERSVGQAIWDAVGALEVSFQVSRIRLLPEPADDIRKTFSTLQSCQAWRSHGAWIREHDPVFGEGVAERFRLASRISGAEEYAALRSRQSFTSALLDLIDKVIVLVPATPCAPPFRNASESTLSEYRARALDLTIPASLAGLPQVTLPFCLPSGLPVGIGLIGGPGSDHQLLSMARKLLPLLSRKHGA